MEKPLALLTTLAAGAAAAAAGSLGLSYMRGGGKKSIAAPKRKRRRSPSPDSASNSSSSESDNEERRRKKRGDKKKSRKKEKKRKSKDKKRKKEKGDKRKDKKRRPRSTSPLPVHKYTPPEETAIKKSLEVLSSKPADATNSNESETDVLSKGDAVIYTRNGEEESATIVNVHMDDHPPYYTIKLPDQREKQTIRSRIRRKGQTLPVKRVEVPAKELHAGDDSSVSKTTKRRSMVPMTPSEFRNRAPNQIPRPLDEGRDVDVDEPLPLSNEQQQEVHKQMLNANYNGKDYWPSQHPWRGYK